MIRFDIVADGGSINYNYPAAQFYFMDINHTSAVLNPPKLIDNRKDAYIPVYFIYPNNQNPDYYRYTIGTILFIRHNVFNEIRNVSSAIYSMIGSGSGNDSVFPCVYISNSTDMVHKELNIDRDEKDALFTGLNILYSVDTFIDGYKNTIFSNLLSKEAIKAKLKNNCFIVDVVNTPFIVDSMKNNNFMYSFGLYQSYLKNLSFVIRGDIIPQYMLSKPTTNPSTSYTGYLERQVTALQDGKLVELLPDNPIKENMFNYSIRLKEVVNGYSEYIRRDFPREQEVTTDLNFTGNLKVKEPTQDLNPATKLYIDNKAQQILNDLKTQVPQVETLNKIKWSFNQIGSYGTSGYSGIGCFTFLNQEGYPYQIVAYSFQHPTIITSLTAQIITTNPAIVWLAPTDANNIASANWNIDGARQITSTPTQEDLDYLAGFQGLIRVKIMLDSYPLVSNFNDWAIMPKAFQCTQIKALSDTQANTGILIAAYYSLAFSFWIDDLESIINYQADVKGLNFMMLASSGSSTYATRTLQIEQSFNDKFINYSGIINPFRNNTAQPIATYAKSLVTINTTKDEAFNRLKLKDTVTNLYLKPTNNIFGFIDWNNTQKKYVFGAL